MTDASPLTWEGKYHALREAYNKNRSSLVAAEGKIAGLRDLLGAIHEAMKLRPGQQQEDATDVVHAVLEGGDWTDAAAQARWLRKELAAIKDGGGTAALARRTIASLATPVIAAGQEIALEHACPVCSAPPGQDCHGFGIHDARYTATCENRQDAS